MVFNCNINAFSNLTSIIYLYNENMNLEMAIRKLGSAYKFRVGRATGNEHIFFLFGLKMSSLLARSNIWDYDSGKADLFSFKEQKGRVTLVASLPKP